MARKLASSVNLSLNPSTSLLDIQSAWQQWYLTETIRRTIFLANAINTLSCRTSKQNPHFYEPLDDMLLTELPLPALDALWKACTALEWAKEAQNLTVRHSPMVTESLFDSNFNQQHEHHDQLALTDDEMPSDFTNFVLATLKS